MKWGDIATVNPKRVLAGRIFDYFTSINDPVSTSQASRIADKVINGTYKAPDGLLEALSKSDPTPHEAIANIQGRTIYKTARSFVRPQEKK